MRDWNINLYDSESHYVWIRATSVVGPRLTDSKAVLSEWIMTCLLLFICIQYIKRHRAFVNEILKHPYLPVPIIDLCKNRNSSLKARFATVVFQIVVRERCSRIRLLLENDTIPNYFPWRDDTNIIILLFPTIQYRLVPLGIV